MLSKIIAISVCGVFLSLIIKEKNAHSALAVSITVCIVILSEIIPVIGSIYKKLQGYYNIIQVDSDIFLCLFKVVVIAIATRLSSELCRDHGERAIGAKIELAGTAVGILYAMPMVDKAVSLIGALQ